MSSAACDTGGIYPLTPKRHNLEIEKNPVKVEIGNHMSSQWARRLFIGIMLMCGLVVVARSATFTLASSDGLTPLLLSQSGDADGMNDSWELSQFGDLSRDGTGDFDGDGMNDLDEFVHGFDPTFDDSYQDVDGDRYPNVFEVMKSSDPTNASSVPGPDFLVDADEGSSSTSDNVYPTVNAAISAAGTETEGYAIIGIRPGTYTASGDSSFTVNANRPHLLIIGLEGAARTVLDGGGTRRGPYIYRRAALSSVTIRRTT